MLKDAIHTGIRSALMQQLALAGGAAQRQEWNRQRRVASDVALQRGIQRIAHRVQTYLLEKVSPPVLSNTERPTVMKKERILLAAVAGALIAERVQTLGGVTSRIPDDTTENPGAVRYARQARPIYARRVG